jgi:hypothetical protein
MEPSLFYVIFPLIFFPAFIFIVIKLLYPAGRRKNQPISTVKEEGNWHGTWSFVAMRYYGLILNRTYKVWVTDQYVCGALVNHVIGAPVTDISADWYDPEYYVNPRLESKYEDIDLASNRFIDCDRANFRLLRAEIRWVDYRPTKWGMGGVPYSGRLILVMENGARVELILLGKQDPQTIASGLVLSPSGRVAESHSASTQS